MTWNLEEAMARHPGFGQKWMEEEVASHLQRWEVVSRGDEPEWQMTPAAKYLWQAIRISWGKPIIINSACRDVEHNKKVGGADKSMHLAFSVKGLYGKAFDLRLPDSDPQGFVRLCDEIVFDGGMGLYLKKGFVHVDTGEGREKRRRWKDV